MAVQGAELFVGIRVNVRTRESGQVCMERAETRVANIEAFPKQTSGLCNSCEGSRARAVATVGCTS